MSLKVLSFELYFKEKIYHPVYQPLYSRI